MYIIIYTVIKAYYTPSTLHDMGGVIWDLKTKRIRDSNIHI